MNINELADCIEFDAPIMGINKEAATMLRQQQAEIEALKAAKIRAYNNGVEDGRKPDTNNKPVAWMFEYGTDRGDAVNGISWYPNVHFKKPELSGLIRNIEPLYTHPVKEQGNPVAWRSQSPDGYWSVYQAPVEGAEPLYTEFKQLTDEEILDLCPPNHSDMMNEAYTIEFARAILRKASEK